jgi:hypothetical protein
MSSAAIVSGLLCGYQQMTSSFYLNDGIPSTCQDVHQPLLTVGRVGFVDDGKIFGYMAAMCPAHAIWHLLYESMYHPSINSTCNAASIAGYFPNLHEFFLIRGTCLYLFFQGGIDECSLSKNQGSRKGFGGLNIFVRSPGVTVVALVAIPAGSATSIMVKVMP